MMKRAHRSSVCHLVWLIGSLTIAFIIVSGAIYQDAEASFGTPTPTASSQDADLKLYSYFCLDQEQTLCLGISTDQDPVYDQNMLYKLQVKRRDNNEAKGLDYRKMRWTVDRINGRIQLSNFTSLCVAKAANTTTLPGDSVLRPCGTQGDLEVFDLSSFLTNVNEQGYIKLRSIPNQCLSLINCVKQTGTDFCDPTTGGLYTGTKINPDQQKGAYVKFLPCVPTSNAGYKSQSWRQTLDCAPGCSPFMMTGGAANTCDEECRNPQCNWDNGACTTNAPTPPTPRPTRSPSTSPTTSRPTQTPSRSPTTSRPSKAPTTSRPSQNPSVSPTTSKPTRTPTRSPSSSPTTSLPTRSPTLSPTGEPTHFPSHHPSVSPTTSKPTVSPTNSPTRSPTFSPTVSPSTSPSMAPTNSPSVSPSSAPSLAPTKSPTVTLVPLGVAAPVQSENWLWLYILIAVLCFLCCGCVTFCCYRRDKRRRAQKKKAQEQSEQKGKDFLVDLESGTDNPLYQNDNSSKMNKPPPPRPQTVTPLESTKASEEFRPRQDSGHLVQVPVEENLPRGAVGLLWGGSNDDSTQDLSPVRRDLKRRSERFTREQLSEILNQRSVTMPLEKVHEAGGEDDEEDYNTEENYVEGAAPESTGYDQPSAVSYHSQHDQSMALVDSAWAGDESFNQEAPSALQSANVDGMSIKELKSFIVESGGDYTGCVEKEQLVTRAREYL